MTSESFAFDPHRQLGEALPWLVNGTLAESEAQVLRAHLTGCASCRRELAQEQDLARRIGAASTVDYAPQPSLARLLQRIDALPARPAWWRRRRAPAEHAGRRRRPLAIALTAQAAALATLAVAVTWLALTPADYRTLSAPATGALSEPHLQLVFADNVTVHEVHDILAQARARVIGASGQVFRVALTDPRADLEHAAQTLRTDPRVRFVSVQNVVPPQP